MKIFFSEVIKLFKLILALPTTTAVSERSFSALKTVSTYLTLTASDNRINDLMILHVHNKKTDNLNISKIAKNLLKETRQENTYLASSNKTKLKF